MSDRVYLFLITLIPCTLAFTEPCFANFGHLQPSANFISGNAEAGRFEMGSTIQMTEITAGLENLNREYKSTIRNHSGHYQIAIPFQSLSTNYVEMKASGHHHNLITGELSSTPLTIYAISDLSETRTVNINVLTDLEKPRVQFLVEKEGLSISEAKSKAQQEVFAIFGFQEVNLPPSETLSILDDSEGGAILMALTILLQAGRETYEMERLLGIIAEEVREDGIFSQKQLLSEMRANALLLNISDLVNNITSMYQTQHEDKKLPDLEKSLTVFMNFISAEPKVQTLNTSDISAESAILHGLVNPEGAETLVHFVLRERKGSPDTLYASENPFIDRGDYQATLYIDQLKPATTYYYQVIAKNEHKLVSGQERSFVTGVDHEQKRYHLGYFAGINLLDYDVHFAAIEHHGFRNIETQASYGFHLGVLGNLRLSESFDLRFAPAFAFGERIIVFTTHEGEANGLHNIGQNIEYFQVGLPLLFKYAPLQKTIIKPYLLVGGKYVHDLASHENRHLMGNSLIMIRTKRHDIAGEFGGGILYRSRYFDFSLEFRYNIGFLNLVLPGEEGRHYSGAITRLSSRGFMVSLIIE